MTQEEKLEMVMEWANEVNTDFDPEFVVSLQNYYGAMGYLTANQEAALDNIIKKWRIEEAMEKYDGG